MINEFVPYKIALGLKKIGFNEFTHFHITKNGDLNSISERPTSMFQYNMEPNEDESDSLIAAPTYSQAFRWFRENHNLHQSIIKYSEGKTFWVDIEMIDENCNVLYKTNLSTFTKYDDAQSACILKLIKLIER
jgi:hypothetical protein